MTVTAAAVIVLGVLPLISSAPELRRLARDKESLVADERNSSELAVLEGAAMLTSADSGLQFSCAEKADGVHMDASSRRVYYRCWRGRREVYTCPTGQLFSLDTARCEATSDTQSRDQTQACTTLGDGLFPDYTTGCRHYYRCVNHTLASSSSCNDGYSYSVVQRACCPTKDVSCVHTHCSPGGEGAFAIPGTRCRAYYHCRTGLRTDHVCPENSVFHVHKQECVQSAEPCYELLCTGRVNGVYPDTSHGCQRSFQCEGGSLRAVQGCPPGSLHDGRSCQPADTVTCPPPDATAVALPGDSCTGLPDGPHAAEERRLGCRVYRLCRSGQTLATLRWENAPCHLDKSVACPAGTLFDGRMCVPSQLASSPEVCSGQDDGVRADYGAGCGGHVRCSGGALVERLSCDETRAWNGSSCVDKKDFPCEGPEPWVGCVALADGLYADLTPDSRCRRYFHCHRGNRTQLTCPHDEVFDGRSCVPVSTYHCPVHLEDTCDGKPDGYYRNMDSGCRSYYFCSNGHKITYLCSGSYVFDGNECVHPDAYECPFSSKDCVDRANGYHPDGKYRCRKYYYCLDGDKITTLVCADGKVFDGRRCVDSSRFECSVPESIGKDVCHDRSAGWFADSNTGCRSYFQCIDGRKTAEGSCPGGKVFDGSSCVDYKTHSGCLALESTRNVVPSAECTNTVNGFYQNFTSGCKSYYYCIDGMKTTLLCPGDQLFNGQLCVNSNSYACPVPAPMSLQTRTSHSIEYKHVIKTNYQTYTILYIIFFPLL